ncbi:hypothetical protein BRC81_11575 [Halobacteriales archaeon QS_1_68_20]|nr:MAG: hypothetical protein BRC81_11575 [Halobacteriales archaeon QS_1_68_20]
MAEPEAVKRALARLAAGVPSRRRRNGTTCGYHGELDRNFRGVVDEATEAVEDLDRAASFREDGGLARLRRAVDAAERAGDRSLARRGQRALAAFEWIAHAADSGHDPPRDDPARVPTGAGGTDERSRPPRSGDSTALRRSRNQ